MVTSSSKALALQHKSRSVPSLRIIETTTSACRYSASLSAALFSALMTIGQELQELFANEQCVGTSDLVSQNTGALVLLVVLYACIAAD